MRVFKFIRMIIKETMVWFSYMPDAFPRADHGKLRVLKRPYNQKKVRAWTRIVLLPGILSAIFIKIFYHGDNFSYCYICNYVTMFFLVIFLLSGILSFLISTVTESYDFNKQIERRWYRNHLGLLLFIFIMCFIFKSAFVFPLFGI